MQQKARASRTEARRGQVRRRAPAREQSNARHRAVLDLQRAVGNRATATLLAGRTSVQRDGPKQSTMNPLSAYPFLKQALSPAQYAALDAPGGRMSVPLVQLLPPGIGYKTREQIIASIYPQLASVSGPSANAKELIDEITESETLREFLTPKLRSPVSIVVNFDESLSFFMDGMEITSDGGMIPLSSLDKVSIATIDSIGHRARDEAIQLADLRFLDAMADYAANHVMPLAMQIGFDPADYAREEVRQMGREMTQLATLAEKIGTGVLPGNQDRAGMVAVHLGIIRMAHGYTESAVLAAAAFADAHQVDNTAGETYDEAEDEYAADSHWSLSGVWNAANWAATKGFHLAGNTLTAGHMDRQAANAKAYQDGKISYNAWDENESWNIGKSLVVAAATALSGGLASRAAAGFFSIEAGYTAAGESTLTGTVVGGASATTGAVAGDAFSKIAAWSTDDHYVRDFQNQSMVGPLGWALAGLGGAIAGGLLGRLLGGGRANRNDDLEGLRESTTQNQGETPPTGVVGDNAEPVAMLNGKQVKPSHWGTVYHGDNLTPEQVVAEGGLPAKGTNWDLVNHSEEVNARLTGNNDSAFRGATTQAITPDGEGGAAHWGEYVYKIKGVPAWDLNQVMEGQVDTGMGFRGPLMHGELENAIPARVPIENIEGYYKITDVGGKLRLGPLHTFAELKK